jgi:hypothetical protein
MGRCSLLTLALALAALTGIASCAPGTTPRAEATSAESPKESGGGGSTGTTDPHASLACAQCHEGGLADHREPAVPSRACTASGCHSDDVVVTVRLATVTFNHQRHVSDSTVAIGCAGCHAHQAGGQPLTAGAETCGLCHAKELSQARGDDCRLCHSDPNWVGMTSQGVPIPHQDLPWIEGGCLRCHYEVTHPVHEVSLTRCAACHQNVDAATRQGIGEDIHPSHTGVPCASCHEADNHRIEAMSSAVDLRCASCHAGVHGTEAAQASVDPSTCNTCHEGVHQDPQRMLLGLLPDSVAATPSNHFMNGLTCRSCHRPDTGTGNVATSQACVDCHRPEYATVLKWWQQGVAERMRIVDSYVAGAARATAGRASTDSAAQAVARARSTLELLSAGGGEHNIPLAQRMFGDALRQAADAYRLAGKTAPPTPSMGRTPRPGLCTYCHYRLEELVISGQMNDAFHRSVVGRGG